MVGPYRSIVIRWLKRERLLESGVSRSITWSRGGEVTGSINVRSEPGRVILDYRQRDLGGEWQPERYPVYLDPRPATWAVNGIGSFALPVAVIGVSPSSMAVQSSPAVIATGWHILLSGKSRGDRAARKADRIRDKLGWVGGVRNGLEPWNKPKGMHQATFDRLCSKHDRFAGHKLAGFAEQFGFDLPDEYRFQNRLI